MAGMTLLRSPAEWARYTQQMATDNGVPPNQVSWGAGPQQYPCLVASTMPSPMRVISCYVYLDDAQNLARAAGLRMIQEVQLAQPQVAGHTSADFEKHTAAVLMAMVEELVEIGALKKDRFEAALNRHLANVDQYHEADKAKAMKDAGQAGTILERLFPNDDGKE